MEGDQDDQGILVNIVVVGPTKSCVRKKGRKRFCLSNMNRFLWPMSLPSVQVLAWVGLFGAVLS